MNLARGNQTIGDWDNHHLTLLPINPNIYISFFYKHEWDILDTRLITDGWETNQLNIISIMSVAGVHAYIVYYG